MDRSVLSTYCPCWVRWIHPSVTCISWVWRATHSLKSLDFYMSARCLSLYSPLPSMLRWIIYIPCVHVYDDVLGNFFPYRIFLIFIIVVIIMWIILRIRFLRVSWRVIESCWHMNWFLLLEITACEREAFSPIIGKALDSDDNSQIDQFLYSKLLYSFLLHFNV